MSAHFWNTSKSATKVLNTAPCFFHVCFMSCSRHRRFLGAGLHLKTNYLVFGSTSNRPFTAVAGNR
jgi:hypothetical protein